MKQVPPRNFLDLARWNYDETKACSMDKKLNVYLFALTN